MYYNYSKVLLINQVKKQYFLFLNFIINIELDYDIIEERYKMKIPRYIKTIMNKIEKNKHEVYIVGGACRDFLMSRKPFDYDLTTSAQPNQIKEIFKKYKIFNYGEKHGTISIYFQKKEVQITTFRCEKTYSDYRHPDEVEFVKDLKEDLSRRDFTINSIAYNKIFIDYFNGIEDINSKLIRCVGDPNLRFKEDALRIMRALRFSVNLEFEIEEETRKGILNNYYLLENISKERIRDELVKLLKQGNFYKILVEYFQVFSFILNFVKSSSLEDLRVNITNTNTSKLQKNDETVVRVSVFIILFVKNKKINLNQIEGDLKQLCFSKKDIFEILKIVENILLDIDVNEIGLKKLLNKHGYEVLRKIIVAKQYLATTDDEIANFKNALVQVNKIEKRKTCYNLKMLNIDGDDIKKIGYKNKEIQLLKEEILEKVINNELVNKKQILIEYLKKRKTPSD